MTIYTIGYGNRKIEEFLNILTQAGIAAICYVRCDPHHAWTGYYTARKLERILNEKGINYYWLEELGNPSKDKKIPNWITESDKEFITKPL